MKCICCEESIQFTDDGEVQMPVGAGIATLDFGYGSEHDQGGRMVVGPDAPPIDRLLSCSIIEAVVCDSCFRRKAEAGCFEGYKIHVEKRRERMV